MRVAVLIPSFLRGKGGAEKVAAQVANMIAAAGGEPWVLCNERSESRPSYPLSAGVTLRPVDLYFDNGDLHELRATKFDLAVGFGMLGFFTRIVRVADILGVPFVVQECTNPARMLRLLTANETRNERRAAWLRQAVFSHASAVRFTVPKYAASVVGDVEPFAYGFYNSLSMAPPVGQKAPEKKIIAVGAMKDANKNGMAAIRAFCAFSRQHHGWSLHLYGVNNFNAELDAIKSESPGAAIVDHGMVDDPAEIYEGAHALVIPSYDEGLPNVVVEAFSHGIPCVGYSDCHGVRDLIEHESRGILVDRSDADALEKAFVRLADIDLRGHLGRSAKAFADENLGYETWAGNWLGMLENAIAGRDARGEPRTPAAFDPQNDRAELWQGLVRCYWALKKLPSATYGTGVPQRVDEAGAAAA